MLRNKGFAFKLSIYVLASTTLILTALLLLNFFVTRQIILNKVKENAKNISYYNVSRIENVLNGAERITLEAANLLESSNLSIEQIHNLLKSYILRNAEIYGGTIAFEPGIYNSNIDNYSPYYFENEDSLSYVDIANVTKYRELNSRIIFKKCIYFYITISLRGT